MRLILASSSPYRKAQLENFGLRFEAFKPEVDEDQLKKSGPSDLTELTRYLALKKAKSLHPHFREAVILGSDQLIDLDGARLDKPGSHANALSQLKNMQGKEHRLITSLVVLSGDVELSFTDITSIRLRKMSDAQIETYLRVDQPYDCAGSYKVERAGLSLVETINSKDPSAIQGLPLMSLCEAFLKLNLPWSEIWPIQK